MDHWAKRCKKCKRVITEYNKTGLCEGCYREETARQRRERIK